MKQIEMGMRITTNQQQTYRVIAVVNQGQQILARPIEPETAPVEVIAVTDIVQIAEQKPTKATGLALDTVAVVGQRYIDNIIPVLAELEVGLPVLLQRESNNQYDDNAISVWTCQHEKLGYIARYQNQPYAALMDQGQLLYGTVTELDKKQQHLSVMVWRTTTGESSVEAMQVRQQLTTQSTSLGAMPKHLLQTPLGTLVVLCNGRPINYQRVPLSPWLTPDDALQVTKRYLITPDWSQVPANSLVTCQVTATADVVQRWQDDRISAAVLTNASSFYVVGLSAQTRTGLNDNLVDDGSQAAVIYRVGQLKAHEQAGFMVSWAPFGDPRVQPALKLALQFTSQPVVPYQPKTPSQTHATFTQQELAAILVSALPNYQGGQRLEPSVTAITVEKIRQTLGDQAYHALANYQQYVQLAATSTEDVDETLLQALIHAVVYHEITTMHYYQPTVGMVDHVIYPLQLFSTATKDDESQLIGCLAFYNYAMFEIQQVPLTAIARIAIIADPEHPQMTPTTESPDWLRIFLRGWNDDIE
ncbi:DNA-binding protein [Lactiplantibacillus pentosus]|uniref:HIRAN domain-containing protein n=2 Tax=Lactiplantibacillus TaxID=2767842 RepID=G0M463_LACPE|nr:HIRAN domain-containing protein [Lactiplantibacillus pentosus]CCC16969.1 putative uncharacterized protein lp_0118 [Lactiplantibacillus pentosus IG1]MCT3282428.1 DNA-binding protein [Lactiplantibacillus pentosus]MCT3301647.1 DNA-binding protein [Lactiplantibacillus pentosus]PRO80090.1 DNA-binding protein [Lactiplantibacillus pentosus]PRO82854.1 DNA-binding protein [Lactiplantibacillus pentosus]